MPMGGALILRPVIWEEFGPPAGPGRRQAVSWSFGKLIQDCRFPARKTLDGKIILAIISGGVSGFASQQAEAVWVYTHYFSTGDNAQEAALFNNDLAPWAPVRARRALSLCTALFFFGLLLFLGPSRSANAEPISCNFSGLQGASIRFDGSGKIDFPNAGSGYGFVVANSTLLNSTSLSLVGLLGKIEGVFTIGSILIDDGREVAAVTPVNGKFSLFDGTNILTANLDWKYIEVDRTSGNLNVAGLVNLTSIEYGGNNDGLKQIKDGAKQSVVLTFQFLPQKSLETLKVGGQENITIYSGSLWAVPEPSSCVMLGGMAIGLLLLLVARLRRKSVL